MDRMKAPKLDSLLRIFSIDLFNPKAYDSKIKQKINELFELFDMVKASKDNDEIKILYFSVEKEIDQLLDEYNNLKNITIEDIIDFHYKFEKIHPFGDENESLVKNKLLFYN